MAYRLFTCALVLMFVPVAASVGQVPARQPLHTGEWLVDGSATFARASAENVSSWHASVDPTGLVFVTPFLALGASVELAYEGFSGGHQWVYGIGPRARWYFGDPASQWLPFVSAAAIPEWISARNSEFPGGTTRSYMLDGSLGLTRLLSPHVGFTGELFNEYSHEVIGTSGNGAELLAVSNQLGLRFGLSVFVH